jgi:hypothetical protein
MGSAAEYVGFARGMDRFGMICGWKAVADKRAGHVKTTEGKLALIDGYPALQTKDRTHVIDFSDFFYYNYTVGIEIRDTLKLEGYDLVAGTSGSNPVFTVKTTINGENLRFFRFQRSGDGRWGIGQMNYNLPGGGVDPDSLPLPSEKATLVKPRRERIRHQPP